MALTKIIGDGLGGTNDLTVDTTTLTVDATNNRVGIGSATPVNTLHIEGSNEADIFMKRADLTNKAWMFNVQSSTGDLNIKSRNDDGSASTTSMIIAHDGYVTKPLQPAFHANKGGTDQSNIATGTTVSIVWSGERFDKNADFDLTNNRFTAPVTGTYFLQLNLRLEAVDIDAGYYLIYIVTSNESYYYIFDNDDTTDPTYYSVAFSVVADMDANDTAEIKIQQNGGAAQTDIDGDIEFSWFAGYLVA